MRALLTGPYFPLFLTHDRRMVLTMRVPLLLWTAPLAAATGFGMGRWARPEREDDGRAGISLVRPIEDGVARPQKPMVMLGETGSRAVPEIFADVAKMAPVDLRRRALSLLGDPARRRDFGLWGPLLARWSETDGAGLIAFVQREAPPGERPWLEAKAWYAWGAAHPQEAAAAGKSLPASLGRELISGMAETDAGNAVALALKMPDAQFNLYGIAATVAASSPEILAGLLPRAVYDGMRQPLQRAQASELVTTDPAGALALAKSAGNIGRDPVPVTMRDIARHDPKKAAELLEEMPSSRSRALSALALAKTWAAEDATAATAWARKSLTGPVKQGALLEIAASTGGPDPLAALELVEEAGWEDQGNFHAIAGYGNFEPGELQHRPTPAKTAGMLLQQFAALEPASAVTFLETRVPEKFRAEVAKIAGFVPIP
jgi:hypothetical protein